MNQPGGDEYNWFSLSLAYEMGERWPDGLDVALDAAGELLNEDSQWRKWWGQSEYELVEVVLRYAMAEPEGAELRADGATVQAVIVVDGEGVKGLDEAGLLARGRRDVGVVIDGLRAWLGLNGTPELPSIEAMVRMAEEIEYDE